MARKSSFPVLRLALILLIAGAAYYFFVQKQGRWPLRDTPRGRREYPRESRRPEPAPGGGAAGQVTCQTKYLVQWNEPANGACGVRMRNGYPVPDPRCTPGGVNPSVTADTLRNPTWRTREVRNCAESEAQKHAAYGWYDIVKPRVNSQQNQVCELDHLVPLELGGADGMGNIWPECGPDGVTLHQRYFKQKDMVENYLAEEVKAGRMSLSEAQQGIARDWTQFLNDADLWCGRTGKC